MGISHTLRSSGCSVRSALVCKASGLGVNAAAVIFFSIVNGFQLRIFFHHHHLSMG